MRTCLMAFSNQLYIYIYTYICTDYQHKYPWMHSTSEAFARKMLDGPARPDT